MTTEHFVIDASVAGKWFLDDEESVDIARVVHVKMLADEIKLHAPVILYYELGNILTKAKRRKDRPLTAERSREAYEYFLEIPITFHDQDTDNKMATLDFANKHHRSFYDSTYICLAIDLGYKWLTAERRFRGGFPPSFPIEHVQILESLKVK